MMFSDVNNVRGGVEPCLEKGGERETEYRGKGCVV